MYNKIIIDKGWTRGVGGVERGGEGRRRGMSMGGMQRTSVFIKFKGGLSLLPIIKIFIE